MEFKLNCESEIDKIVQSTGRDNTSLLDTLEVFLDSNESLIATSKKLDIHVNTVKYRIERIKKIIGDETFNNCDTKLKLHLALKVRKIF